MLNVVVRSYAECSSQILMLNLNIVLSLYIYIYILFFIRIVIMYIYICIILKDYIFLMEYFIRDG